MKKTASGFVAHGALMLSGLLLMHAPLGLCAQEISEVLPDLTELPAMRVDDANHSVQLAVARAGNRLVSVGEQGIVLLSDDDGQSWSQASGVPVSVTLTDVEFISPTEGWAVGHSGVVLRTETAGEQWVKVMTGQEIVATIKTAVESLPESEDMADVLKRNASYLTGDEPVLDVHFSENGEGWLLGAYGIALHSRDAGQTWDSAFSITGNPNSYHLYQYIPADSHDGLIVGERGLVSRSAEESGVFESSPIDYQGTFFGGVASGSDQFVLFGLRGNVWAGAGDSWTQIPTGSQASFSAGVLTPVGIVLGDVTGRLFLKSGDSEQVRELAQASDAAITDLIVSPGGQLVMSTARGPKRLELDSTEFK
ncbi:YCF48-related protein [Marinobacter pelagius]|nr:YCF48-related protein [Marinobacter pelagius]